MPRSLKDWGLVCAAVICPTALLGVVYLMARDTLCNLPAQTCKPLPTFIHWAPWIVLATGPILGGGLSLLAWALSGSRDRR